MLWLNSSQLSLDLRFRNYFSLFLNIVRKGPIATWANGTGFRILSARLQLTIFCLSNLTVFPITDDKVMLSPVLPAQTCVSTWWLHLWVRSLWNLVRVAAACSPSPLLHGSSLEHQETVSLVILLITMVYMPTGAAVIFGSTSGAFLSLQAWGVLKLFKIIVF